LVLQGKEGHSTGKVVQHWVPLSTTPIEHLSALKHLGAGIHWPQVQRPQHPTQGVAVRVQAVAEMVCTMVSKSAQLVGLYTFVGSFPAAISN
jgi:hypothetical protein